MQFKTMLLSALLIGAMTFQSCAILQPGKFLQKQVDKTLDKVVNLIELEKYKEVVNSYIDKASLEAKGIKTDGMLGNLFQGQVSKLLGGEVLTRLKSVQEMKPSFSQNNTVATYKGSAVKVPVKFRKKNGKWKLSL